MFGIAPIGRIFISFGPAYKTSHNRILNRSMKFTIDNGISIKDSDETTCLTITLQKALNRRIHYRQILYNRKGTHHTEKTAASILFSGDIDARHLVSVTIKNSLEAQSVRLFIDADRRPFA